MRRIVTHVLELTIVFSHYIQVEALLTGCLILNAL